MYKFPKFPNDGALFDSVDLENKEKRGLGSSISSSDNSILEQKVPFPMKKEVEKRESAFGSSNKSSMLSVSKSKGGTENNDSQKIILKSMRRKKKNAKNSIGSSFGEESSENPKKNSSSSYTSKESQKDNEGEESSLKGTSKVKVVRRSQSKRFLTRLERQKDQEIQI